MNHQRKRNFRPRPKNNFRRRINSSNKNQNGHFHHNNGNSNFRRNGSMSNPLSLEKTIQKFNQLAKDAQTMGDPVLVENYLQHADHYSRRLSEINAKSQELKNKEDTKTSVDLSQNKQDTEIKN
tara:strand:+ start:163 stop:534 length:372 start_codon:yes stop_codon:yes gene_type:complete